MGRSLSISNAKAVSSLITTKLSDVVARRGYAAAGVSSSVRAGSEEPAKISWVPDPKTGYYRPENHVDAAEVLVKNKINYNTRSN